MNTYTNTTVISQEEKQRKIDAAIAGLRKSHSAKKISYEQFSKRFDWIEATAKKWGCEVDPETYIVREASNSYDPADEGSELKRFRGINAYDEARKYCDNLWLDDKVLAYISTGVTK